ncbi:MAG: ribonucleotide-diphosphate reductase subunit alpha, partial [Hyphomonadaceae bacterium]
SLNIFLPGDVDKWDLHMLHWMAWERGVKSLYYCRSKSVQRAGFANGEESATAEPEAPTLAERTDYEECLACQ